MYGNKARDSNIFDKIKTYFPLLFKMNLSIQRDMRGLSLLNLITLNP